MGLSGNLTVIACPQLAVFPFASLAVQVIKVTPIGKGSVKAFPSLRTPITVTPGQSSVATGIPGLTVAVDLPGSVNLNMLPGQTITGGIVSGLTVVRSLAVSFELTRSLPPVTCAVLVTLAGAVQLTLTARVMTG